MELRKEHRLWGKDKWRGKFFSSEEKEGNYLRQKGNLDDDVADFLHASGDSTGTERQHLKPQPGVEAASHTKWPSTSQPSTPSAGMPLYPIRKPPRRKGLHVTFESAAPEIIGQGGDEAELPTIEISRPQKLPQLGAQPHIQLVEKATESVQRLPPKDYSSGTVAQSVASVIQTPELASLRRKPTRVNESRGNHGLQIQDLSTAQYDLNYRRPSLENAKYEPQRIAEGMSEENLKDGAHMTPAISRDFHATVASPPYEGETARSCNVMNPKGNEEVSSLNLRSLEPVLPSANPLTSIPLPRPAQRLTPSDYPFPSLRQGETASSSLESTRPLNQIWSQDENSATLSSDVRPSLRSIAKHLGDDAVEDVGARVQRFYEVFRLGTIAFSSLTDISVAQWIRSSAWWFLRGRTELESAVRGRPRSADGPSVGSDMVLSRELKQAYLDLAKAWWITKAIIPSHPELKKYGDASTSSLIAIVGSFGNAELAEAIEVHLGIIASMRALSMSMKRNDKLPPDDFEIQGLVARVWIHYPILPASFQSLLSARNPKSLVSARSHNTHPCFPITVGDTKHCFNYGCMFVEISRNDGQDEIHLPCIITILRKRSGWDLDFTLASQDGQVNITVQNNKQAGLTWEDVRWKVKMQAMHILLTDGFEIDVQFSEKDFKSLWGIRDYTQRVLKDFQCGKTEFLVFETSVRCFQYLSPKGTQVFPAESIQDCKLRLFEKTFTFIESSGQRRVHDGHRLIVVTPPSVKTLSSITQDVGRQAPILFNYLRGEEGAPAILLRSPDPPDSSHVITFHDSSERKLFHTLLDGTSMKIDENCSACMPLKSFSVLEAPTISEKPNDISSSTSSERLLADFQWHQLRVLGKRHEDEDHGKLLTVCSENLRVWADCDKGTFVDRINLSMFTP